MRWRIQGSDVSDGKAVLLDVDAENAVEAVSQAHDRKIVVGRVVRSGGKRLLRVAPYALFGATVILSIYTGVLRTQLTQARQGVAESGMDTRRMLSDLETARDDAKALRDRVAFLESSLSEREKQREAAMKELAGKLAASEDLLRNAQSAAANLDKTGKEAAAKSAQLGKQMEGLKRDIAAGSAKYKELEQLAAGERAKGDDLSKELAQAIARATDAEARVASLDARMGQQAQASAAAVAELKNQLAQAKVETESPMPRAALAANYDAALDFATLQVGKPAIEGVRGSAAVTVLAISPEHASSFTMHTDKRRIFDVTLQVCLAEDTPKEILTDNRATLAKFAEMFAPQWKGADEWLAAAFKSVAGKGENERAVLLSDYYRVSVWGNKAGQFSVLVEPKGSTDR